jgi:Phage Tail Collar Domain
MISRRSLIGGLLAAPAIVRLPSLMLMPRAPWPPLLAPVPGFLACNGALVSIAEYPDLFAVMGHSYGEAPGRFRLPDLGASVIKPMRYLISAAPRWDWPVGKLMMAAA